MRAIHYNIYGTVDIRNGQMPFTPVDAWGYRVMGNVPCAVPLDARMATEVETNFEIPNHLPIPKNAVFFPHRLEVIYVAVGRGGSGAGGEYWDPVAAKIIHHVGITCTLEVKFGEDKIYQGALGDLTLVDPNLFSTDNSAMVTRLPFEPITKGSLMVAPDEPVYALVSAHRSPKLIQSASDGGRALDRLLLKIRMQGVCEMG